MKRFETVRTLGDGGFGTVYECIDKESNERVAIKKIKQRFASFDECLQLKEVKSLRKIKHVNVVKLLQIFRENDSLCLVFELMGETLLQTIDHRQQRNEPFKINEIRNIMSEIFVGLAYVHKQGFFHRDMKPDNVMWSTSGVIKISDFGLAREIRSRPPYTEYVSTRWYRAPEIVLRSTYYNSPVDIWASGAIMAELFMGKPIFPGASETDQLFKIISVLGTPGSSWPEAARLANRANIRLPQVAPVRLETLMPTAPPEAISLMNELFSLDPGKRPSAMQALSHPFFAAPPSPVVETVAPLAAPPAPTRPHEQPQMQRAKTGQLPTSSSDWSVLGGASVSDQSRYNTASGSQIGKDIDDILNGFL